MMPKEQVRHHLAPINSRTMKEMVLLTGSPRCMYDNSLAGFLHDPEMAVLGVLHDKYHGDTRTTTTEAWKEEIQAVYPDHEIVMNPLSLSVSCHIGPGALAITCTKKLLENRDESACRPDVQ